MKKITVSALFLFIALSSIGYSQSNTNPTDPTQTQNNQNEQRGRRGFWEANLTGGNYVVAISRITSVSRHKYLLDGAVIVDEVTVDTDGQSLARFYFITPATKSGPASGVADLADRAAEIVNNTASEHGSSLQDMVVKKYPLTTHSKTVEYRLLSEAQLTALYSSVKTAWQTGDGRVYKGQ